MASINGITLKNMKTFRGHEYPVCYQGNIYLGRKKIGFWSQDSWGGPDEVDLERDYSEFRLVQKVKALNEDKAICGKSRGGEEYKLDYDLEMLMSDLVELTDIEKSFKKYAKKHEGKAIAYASIKVPLMGVNDGYLLLNAVSDEAVRHVLKKELSELYSKYGEDKVQITIYRKLDDFNIGERITLEDIAA